MQTLPKTANLFHLQSHWTHSVFQRYDHLTSIFVPQIAIEDVIWDTEALTNCTQKALNNGVMLMRKAVLQNHTALDTLTAAQGGTCAIITTECCVYIPDIEEHNPAMTDRKTQIINLSDPKPSLIG